MPLHLSRFVNSEKGKIIMSILLGFGLASLFRSVCKDKDCVLFHAPPLEEIKDKIYKYTTKSVSCDKNKKIISY